MVCNTLVVPDSLFWAVTVNVHQHSWCHAGDSIESGKTKKEMDIEIEKLVALFKFCAFIPVFPSMFTFSPSLPFVLPSI